MKLNYYSETNTKKLGESPYLDHYPKIVMQSLDNLSSIHVISNMDEYFSAEKPLWVKWDSVTLEPTAAFTQGEGGVELGRDYDTLVISFNNTNGIIHKQIPPPKLTYLGGGTFSWSSSYLIPSRLYRARSTDTSVPPDDSEFSVQAEIDGTAVPGGGVTYTTIIPPSPVFTYFYYVRNRNGKSNILAVAPQ